jgi:hypothetical protein
MLELRRMNQELCLSDRLTTHSARHGAPSHICGQSDSHVEWVAMRGGWGCDGFSKLFTYITQTARGDMACGRALSDWPEKDSGGVTPSLPDEFDNETFMAVLFGCNFELIAQGVAKAIVGSLLLWNSICQDEFVDVRLKRAARASGVSLADLVIRVRNQFLEANCLSFPKDSPFVELLNNDLSVNPSIPFRDVKGYMEKLMQVTCRNMSQLATLTQELNKLGKIVALQREEKCSVEAVHQEATISQESGMDHQAFVEDTKIDDNCSMLADSDNSDPFRPLGENGIIHSLAGISAVSAFLHYYDHDQGPLNFGGNKGRGKKEEFERVVRFILRFSSPISKPPPRNDAPGRARWQRQLINIANEAYKTAITAFPVTKKRASSSEVLTIGAYIKKVRQVERSEKDRLPSPASTFMDSPSLDSFFCEAFVHSSAIPMPQQESPREHSSTVSNHRPSDQSPHIVADLKTPHAEEVIHSIFQEFLNQKGIPGETLFRRFADGTHSKCFYESIGTLQCRTADDVMNLIQSNEAAQLFSGEHFQMAFDSLKDLYPNQFHFEAVSRMFGVNIIAFHIKTIWPGKDQNNNELMGSCTLSVDLLSFNFDQAMPTYILHRRSGASVGNIGENGHYEPVLQRREHNGNVYHSLDPYSLAINFQNGRIQLASYPLHIDE